MYTEVFSMSKNKIKIRMNGKYFRGTFRHLNAYLVHPV